MYLKDIILSKMNCQKVAIQYKNNNMTYHQIYKEVLDHVKEIESRKINRCIGIYLPNSIDYALAYFTITFLDRVIVPINVEIKAPEIQSTIEYCNINLIITNLENKKSLYEYLGEFDQKVLIYTLDEKRFESIGIKDCYTFESDIDEDVAIMLHTSGTTSNPKRVMLTHQNLYANIQSNIQSLKLTSEEKCLIALPMFFGYCNTAQFLTHLFLGATIVIMEGFFLPQRFFKIAYKEKITNFTGVPSMLLMMLKFKKSLKHELPSLRYICFGGSGLAVDKLKDLMEMFPYTGFIQTYGQTEASPRVTALLPEDSIRKIGSVGKAIPGVTVRIVNNQMEDVPAYEIGEIIVAGKNVMKGYYRRPEETRKVLCSGWLYTNDLGYYDEEGFVYLVGRKKNMLISGGINLYPEEIEEIIANHPDVLECRVYCIEHDLLQEAPAAKIVLKEEVCGITEEILLEYCRQNLADYKVPHVIEFVKELPKTVTGKICRYDVETKSKNGK